MEAKRSAAGPVSPPSRLSRFRQQVRDLYVDIRKENIPRLFAAVFAVVLFGGIAVFMAERGTPGKMFSQVWDAFWWGIVTVTSVGYGDKYPVTAGGKIAAALIMITGVVLTSILSGTVASIYVDRKIREGKGLQELSLRGHTILCGWNRNAEGVLEGFTSLWRTKKQPLVLVSELDPERFQELTIRHPSIDLRFVRGDAANEKVLLRAGVQQARSVIIIPDSTGNRAATSDERTILTALAVKSLNPEAIVSAEILDPENEPHLRRAMIDNIQIHGEYSGYLLSSGTVSQGIPAAVREMLSFRGENGLRQLPLPAGWVGKTFLELSEHFLRSRKGVLVGILSEEKSITLDDILSNDPTGIDEFIKRKFREADIDLREEEVGRTRIRINPEPDYVLRERDSAFVIGAAS